MPDPIVSRADGVDPEQRGAARRLGRPRAARRARDAGPRRAPGVRAARHVRGAVRRDRADGRPLAGRRRASSPAARAGACSGEAPRPTPTSPRQREVVDAFFAAARDGDFDALVAVLDPDVVLRSDGGALRAGRHGASCTAREKVAGAGAACSRTWLAVRAPALVNGAAGVVVAPQGRPFSVMAFTVGDGRIVDDRRAGRPGAPARSSTSRCSTAERRLAARWRFPTARRISSAAVRSATWSRSARAGGRR